MNISIIAGKFKPFHSAHLKLIQKASQENDQLLLFVSLKDTIKNKEFPVYGSDMAKIWMNQLLDLMPSNTEVIFCEDESPVRKIYAKLGKAQDEGDDKFFLYSDINDIMKNFSEKSINKYLNKLNSDGRLYIKSIDRDRFENISSTKMREYLSNSNKVEFIKNLPSIIQDKDYIWNLLYSRKPTPQKSVWSF